MRCGAVTLGVALLAYTAGAQAPAQPAAADALKPFQFLLGTWTTQAELPGAGQAGIERTWRSIFNGKFLVQTEVTRSAGGEVTREMWLGVDPGKQALAAWTFSSDGSFAVFSVTPAAGDALALEGRLIGSSDSGAYRSTIQRTGDRFTHSIDRQKDGTWTRYATLIFARGGAASAPAAPAPAPAGAAVKPLELLAGDWRAEGESDGVKFAVDYDIAWILGGHFLRSDYSVTTGAQTELHAVAYMFFDPESKSLRQLGFSAEGSVSAMKISATPASVVFDGEMHSPTRRTLMRSTYTRPEADTLTTTTEMQRADGSWRRAGAVSLKRRR
jgi:hypothetical protein